MARVYTKIGDIYRTTNKDSRFIQLVAIDPIDMNADVLVVFSADAKIEDVREGSATLDFYVHSYAKEGLRLGLWEKVIEGPVHVAPTSLKFKNYYGQDIKEVADEADGLDMPPNPLPQLDSLVPR